MPLEPGVFEAELNEWTTVYQEFDDGKGLALVNDNRLGFRDGKLIFFQINSMSQGDPRGPRSTKWPIYLKWEKFLDEYRANAPDSMKNMEQTGKVWWAWLPSELAFIQMAF